LSIVVALGGNALMRPGERGTAAEQRANLREACAALRPLLAERELVVTHGNGPQVGNELLRQERAADVAPPLPLYLAVAQTQAEIGALIESELEPVAGRPVVCLLTHVLVAEDDPAFAEPTKPVGPFYGEDEARALERDRGWQVVHDSGRGWRRVVPSPKPLEVVELGAIRSLLASGSIVVACGGGGIPATKRGEHLAGIDAVIDKDRASSLLARELGADRLVILTDAEALLAELAAGSMRPKVEASVEFVRATGHEALITSPAALGDALERRTGTRIHP